MANLFGELKRRNVVRVGIAYVVLGWVALQLGDILFDMFEAPAWVGKSFAALLLLGFPFVCLFAWAFEMTPEGVKKTAEVDRSESITHSTGRRLDFVIIAALVVALGYFIWHGGGATPADEPTALDRSIAVLPFVNMSSDEEQEWFADGLTEEILNSLARTPDLLVASRTSSFQYKGQNQDISAIAAALGVAHVLEGSVRRGGERLRVTAQLIRASDGFHLWSETFDRKPEDVIAIQEDVAFEIANALETAMDPDALKRMVSSGTGSVAAYEAYLEGLAGLGNSNSTGNPDDWAGAQRDFQRATNIDETFALAYWNQAQYWESQMGITDVGSDSSGLPTEQIIAEFLRVSNAAIENSNDETQGLKYEAFKKQAQLRYREAIKLAEEYVQLHPHDLEGMNTLFDSLAAIGDVDMARKYVQPVINLARDDALALNVSLTNILFVGLAEEAADLAREVLPKYPEHGFIAYQGHRALLWVGAVDEARPHIDTVRANDFPEENLRLVLLRQACADKDNESALQLANWLISRDENDLSINFIVNQIMGNPREAHQLLIDAELDIQALRSFLGYPFFNHTYFPELVKILEQQGIDRHFVHGPPYRCEAQPTK
jgi:TolB-like protein